MWLWLIASIVWIGYVLFLYMNLVPPGAALLDELPNLVVAMFLPPSLIFLMGLAATRLVRRLQKRN
jgi:hypothetical protein